MEEEDDDDDDENEDWDDVDIGKNCSNKQETFRLSNVIDTKI